MSDAFSESLERAEREREREREREVYWQSIDDGKSVSTTPCQVAR